MSVVMLTGASGFVGRHVAREAERRPVELRVMSHRKPVAARGAAVVPADLGRPDSLRGVCEGVDVLVHCAAQIGGTEEANEAVNARGTTALVAEAQRAGVSRIVLLSTASVYGRGVFRGDRPDELVRNPGSATSRTRAVAEDAVLSAGGVVLRPHLIYGEGDTWVGPGLADSLRVLAGSVAGWPSRMSVISVRELATLVVDTALAPACALTARVYHAAHPVPVTAERLLRAVAECAAIPWPQKEISLVEAREALTRHGRSTTALDMLTTDHFFDSIPLWNDLRRVPDGDFDAGFSHAVPWYRQITQE
ncbi:NAD-dependent epimerase/dehydratase family protein [Streptomyces sp. NPDC048420]|uniref:NAD-dependent epimerase/dehydratase family protein n=1 Tax=Streptomyces sp. NPDC048420 TaxID=3155755 RepID=UPI0034185AED